MNDKPAKWSEMRLDTCVTCKLTYVAAVRGKPQQCRCAADQRSVGDVPAPLYKCCSPYCPGFPYRASDQRHPPDICRERDVPAPMHEKYLPITHFDVMLAKVGEALKEYEEDWRKGCANSATSHAEYERAAVVKYLREAEVLPHQAHVHLRLAADAIERGEHLK